MIKINEIWQKVLKNVDEKGVVELTRDTVRIPSIQGETARLAEFLASKMDKVGLEVELQRVEKNRANVIGRLRGSGEGPSLLFNGHLHHLRVCDGWTRDPFGGEIEGGWIYGAGVQNMKAADSAYLVAVDAVKKSNINLKGDVIIEYVMGESSGGLGTKFALNHGVTADMFISGECTELNILTLHAGVVRLKVHTIGSWSHYATPKRGVSAIEEMVKVLNALGKSQVPIERGKWLKFEHKLGYEGLPQMCIGSIRGGTSREYQEVPVTLPDFCTIMIDMRIVPGQTPESVESDVRGLLEKIRSEDPGFRYEVETALEEEGYPWTFMPPFEGSRDTPIFRSVSCAHKHVTGYESDVNVAPFKFGWTDAATLSNAGIDGVVYGPGGKHILIPDERCPIDQIVTATKTYALTIADVCTKRKSDL